MVVSNDWMAHGRRSPAKIVHRYLVALRRSAPHSGQSTVGSGPWPQAVGFSGFSLPRSRRVVLMAQETNMMKTKGTEILLYVATITRRPGVL